MSQRIRLETPTGYIGAYRADPTIPAKGAIVLVQEIFGVNSHIREVADRFAQHGYITVAPALFDHIDEDVELTYDEAGVERGRQLASEVGFNRAVDDVDAAARQLSAETKVAVIGYCWGGTVAFLSCARLSLPAVSYYGGRSVPFLNEKAVAPMLFHFGSSDPIISAEDVQQHRERQPLAAVHVYDAGHGFNCDQRADYAPEAAAVALERTLGFLEHVLR